VRDGIQNAGANGYVILGDAILKYFTDRNEESLDRARASAQAFRFCGDKWARQMPYDLKRTLCGMLDRYPDSLEAANAAAEVSRAAGDKSAEAKALVSQADALRMLDRYPESWRQRRLPPKGRGRRATSLAKPTP